MNIPNELVSQFAKVTHTKKEKTERSFYGTIIEKDGKTYVKLDGSNVLTPVSFDKLQTTVDMRDGDRVMVIIKNHTAIVTGNLKSPAARTDDVKVINENITKAARSATDYIRKEDELVVFEDTASEEATDLRIDAKSLRFYIKSITALYKPYYEFGDSINLEWNGTGFISDSSSSVYFSIPLAKPVIGNPSVTVTSENELLIRQNGSVSSHTQPTYSATLTCDGGIINVIATLSSNAAVNEAPCGITASVTIVFS